MSKINLERSRDVARARRTGRPRPCARRCSCRSGKGGGALCGGGDDGHRRADRPQRSQRSDRATVHSKRRGIGDASRARMPIRSAITRIRRLPASCIATPIGCCSSWSMSARCIAVFVFAAKWSGRARRPRCRRPPTGRRARLYPRAHGNLGGHPDRRRSPDAVAAAARRNHGGSGRDRSRQDHPAFIPACRSPIPRASAAR